MSELRRVCVFCGSSAGALPEYAAAAEAFGAALARRGLELVYGGGRVGLMGRLADAVLAAGGHVIGVIPEALVARELAHQGVDELRVTASMHERKALMAELADAFVALPGGLGTLEELFEAWSWAQLGLHAKPCGWLDVQGYYASLARFLDHAAAEGFLSADCRAMLVSASEPEILLDRLSRYEPPTVQRWLRPQQA